MTGMLDLFLFLFAFAIVGAGVISSRILGLALTLVSWSSFALSLKYGGSVDVRVGYMSILAWMLAMGGVLVCRMSGRREPDLREFLVFSYVPPVVLLLLLNGHVYLGILALVVLMVINDDSISKKLPSGLFGRNTVLALLIFQIVLVGLLTRSPYVIPYAFILWGWYKLEVGKC